ncbi:hypothetical protein N1A38_004653 [Salmonella enterica]|nr:hypothetical protein [Salmonella enterica]
MDVQFPLEQYRIDFEKSLSAFCNWSLIKDKHGKYIDKNTQYAWSEYLRINYINTLQERVSDVLKND